MYRLYVVITIALLIFLQSNCFTFENGALINRCGLWQRFSGNAIIIYFKEEINNLNKITIKNIEPNLSCVNISNTAIQSFCSASNTSNTSNTFIVYGAGGGGSAGIMYSAPHTYAISGMSMTIPTSTITMSTIGPINYENWQRNRR